MQVRSSIPLAAGMLASIGASICCVLPLVLVSVGLGGAWLSVLHGFAPFRPIFVAAALGALAFAYWQLFLRAEPQCEPSKGCADPAVLRRRRFLFWLVSGFVVLLLASPWLIGLAG